MDRAFLTNRYKSLGGRLIDLQLSKVIRINTLRITEAECVKRLTSLDVQLKKIPFLKFGYEVIKSPFSLGAITECLLGYYYLQESASQLPVQVLEPIPSDVVLDMAAAPGGKTTQIAQWMDDKGVIIAIEKANFRIVGLKTNLERCGTSNVVVYNTDATKAADWNIKFDKVLLDAPCSGNYVTDKSWIAKRQPEHFSKNAQDQKRLLSAGISVLKRDGILVYSTCSSEPEDNELIIDWALQNLPVVLEKVDTIGDPGLTSYQNRRLSPELIKCRRLWPHKTNTQPFFIAKFRRTE